MRKTHLKDSPSTESLPRNNKTSTNHWADFLFSSRQQPSMQQNWRMTILNEHSFCAQTDWMGMKSIAIVYTTLWQQLVEFGRMEATLPSRIAMRPVSYPIYNALPQFISKQSKLISGWKLAASCGLCVTHTTFNFKRDSHLGTKDLEGESGERWVTPNASKPQSIDAFVCEMVQ